MVYYHSKVKRVDFPWENNLQGHLTRYASKHSNEVAMQLKDQACKNSYTQLHQFDEHPYRREENITQPFEHLNAIISLKNFHAAIIQDFTISYKHFKTRNMASHQVNSCIQKSSSPKDKSINSHCN